MMALGNYCIIMSQNIHVKYMNRQSPTILLVFQSSLVSVFDTVTFWGQDLTFFTLPSSNPKGRQLMHCKNSNKESPTLWD